MYRACQQYGRNHVGVPTDLPILISVNTILGTGLPTQPCASNAKDARQDTHQLGWLSANPIALTIALAYAAAWIVLLPHSFDWHAVATLATWLMTLLIQRAEHREPPNLGRKVAVVRSAGMQLIDINQI